MNLELNTLMVAVFFAPVTLVVLGNVLDLVSTGYKAATHLLPSPRPATVAPRAPFEAANDAHVRVAA